MYPCESSRVRADRLLSLVLLLRHRGRMTAAALARELEVSTRTVLRDVEALSAAGIPVYAERGRDGGFALLPGFSTDLTGLTHDEAVALLTSPSRATSDALGMGPAFSSAMAKLVAAMPDVARERATGAAERVLVRRGGLLGDPDTEDHLVAVQQAVFAGHRLRICYPSRGDAPTWRTIDPIGLVSAAGRWYLMATHDGADRTYRVSRITGTEDTGEPAARPEGIDLEALWLARRSEFRATRHGIAVQLRVSPDRRDEVVRTAVAVDAEGPDGAGAVLVDLRFGDLIHAERVIWPLVPDVEVLGPADLRAAVHARAAAVAGAHS